VCCSVLQCVAMCCNVLQCVAMRCSVLQRVAVYCRVVLCITVCCKKQTHMHGKHARVAACCSTFRDRVAYSCVCTLASVLREPHKIYKSKMKKYIHLN